DHLRAVHRRAPRRALTRSPGETQQSHHEPSPLCLPARSSAGDRRADRHPRARRLFAAVLGLLLVTAAPPAAAATYTITVDASKQTAGNPRFWSAAVGTGVGIISLRAELQTHAKIANPERR